MTIIKADPAEGNPKYTLPDIVAYDSASGITKNTGNTRVPIPLEELVLAKCRSVTIDISLLTLTVFLTAGQLALYNFYFVSFKDERLDRMVQHANATEHCHLFCNESDRLVAPKYMEPYKRSFELKFVWYFLAPDIIAVASMAALPIYAFYQKRRTSEKPTCNNAVANIRYASISWFIYAIVINVKIVVGAKSFLKILQCLEFCNRQDTLLSVNTFVLILCASALIFLTLILSHHAHTAEAKELLHEITEKVTFDVLDGVHFLAILFTQDSLKFLFKNPSMENGIIWLTCFNFLLPTIALMKLFTKLSDTVEKARLHLLASLVKDFSSVLLNLLLVNVPYFVVRCYLWSDMSWEISVFMLKNGIMIVIQTRLVVIYIRRFIKYRRNTLNQ